MNYEKLAKMMHEGGADLETISAVIAALEHVCVDKDFVRTYGTKVKRVIMEIRNNN